MPPKPRAGTTAGDVKIVVVDMHAEATSEKVAMGWHLDGRVSVVFGTHTHVPTADERSRRGGTAYVTDLGMAGPYDSVLGRAQDRVLHAMTTGMPTPFDVATDDARMYGVIVSVDLDTGLASNIGAALMRRAATPWKTEQRPRPNSTMNIIPCEPKHEAAARAVVRAVHDEYGFTWDEHGYHCDLYGHSECLYPK